MSVERIPPERAREETQGSKDALLVCAYADEAKCKEHMLAGAVPVKKLEEQAQRAATDRRLIFY